MNEAKLSANFKLYAPDGAQVQFTIRDDEPAAHLALLDSYRAALAARGYSVQEPNFDGQKIEAINAYVMGESSKGDACAYLYSSKPAYKWRLATVYVERFAELPFKPAGKLWEASAAPERAEAVRKGFLEEVPEFKITLEQTEPDAEGKAHWRFAGVVPSSSAVTPSVPSQPAPSQPVASDKEFEGLPSASDAPATETELKAMFAQAGKVYGNDLREFKNWLYAQYQVETSKALTMRQVTEITTKLRQQMRPA